MESTHGLAERIEDALFNTPIPEGQSLMMHTGHGGCAKYIVAWLEVIGKPVTWRNFRHEYVAMIHAGIIIKRGGSYQIK